MKNPKFNVFKIEKLFKAMIEEMPIDKFVEMTLYKFAKSDEISDDRILSLLVLYNELGLIRSDFYMDKISELVEENGQMAYFAALNCGLYLKKELQKYDVSASDLT